MIDNKEPPDWAMARAAELAGVGKIDMTANAFAQACSQMQVGFARYIAAHEEAPVDPALIAARELFSQHHSAGRVDLTFYGGLAKSGAANAEILSGDFDRHGILLQFLAGIHRGIELAKTGGAA